jgi:hypothetical protein
MCTGDELARSSQTNVGISAGWYAAAAWAVLNNPNNNDVDDCNGYTYAGSADYWGGYWSNTEPSATECHTVLPVLCCD